MGALRRIAKTLARFVALSVTMYAAWLLVVNLVELQSGGWVLVWILASGAAGVVGGVLYLLSFDGPDRFHTSIWRMSGWSLMLVCVLLPTSLQFLLVPAVVVALPGFILEPISESTGSESSISA